MYYVAGVGICNKESELNSLWSMLPYDSGGANLTKIQIPPSQVRHLISKKLANEIKLRIQNPLFQKTKHKNNWNQKVKLFQKRFKSLDPMEVLSIYEELHYYKLDREEKGKKLSHAQKIWLDQTKKIVQQEVDFVLSQPNNSLLTNLIEDSSEVKRLDEELIPSEIFSN